MTERLYYADSYLTQFRARVTEQSEWQERAAVVLDRTAFYPTSGGQPADHGTLGGVAVQDVVVRDGDNAVLHILARGLEDVSPGVEVEGRIDWSRRFDHMQQHTGQHILSAAFEQVLDGHTVGFHLGADYCTVDISLARLDQASVLPVEDLVNQVVWDNRPVVTRFVGAEELAALSVRRPPVVEGAVRIVDVTGFDVNPCGGTHVAHTGEIGLIRIVRLEYRGDETRVEFLCGERALRDYREKDGVIGRLTDKLTVGYWELDQAVERLQGEIKRLRKDLRRTRERLLKAEAGELAKSGVAHKSEPYRVVWRVIDGRAGSAAFSPDELRALAQELARHQDVVALLAGVGTERTHLVFARNADGKVDLDVGALLRDAAGRLGGKGGGRPFLAQGSAPASAPDEVEAVLIDLAASLGFTV
jgi:alanyl-tRNA synthetase